MPSPLLQKIPLLKKLQPALNSATPKGDEFSGGNSITLLKNGAEFFPSLITAIDSATRDVRIETYIFDDDAAGQQIGDALKSAARRGVPVRVVVDGLGSGRTPATFFDGLKQAGVEFAVFRPERNVFNFKRSRLRRVHRKIALIDGRLGFVGGINLIGDLTQALSDTEPRYDYTVRIEGPLLVDIYAAVNRLWRVLLWSSPSLSLSRSFPQRHKGDSLYSPDEIAPAGDMDARFVVRDNFRYRRSIEDEYLNAIQSATQQVLIVSPYFLPGRKLRRALRDAAARGVAVTLLLQGRADHVLLQLATRALYAHLLEAGVIIYEYEIAMLHGKVAVIDQAWATVGSSNLDPFSLFLNREANVIVRNSAFVNQLRDSVNAEIKRGALQLQAPAWQRRSAWSKAQSWCAYGFARLVAGWVGFRSEWGG